MDHASATVSIKQLCGRRRVFRIWRRRTWIRPIATLGVLGDLALPDFFIAHSGLGRVGAASKVVSHTRSFRLTQTIGERFRNMPKVTIARIGGRARGGGSEIALGVDMCFAAVGKAIFGHPEVAIGLVPGGGATQRLPRLIGRGRTLEVLLGCIDLLAELAERYGCINRACPEIPISPDVPPLV
jgi:enoyl-CoA hydratase/carnithine racemase